MHVASRPSEQLPAWAVRGGAPTWPCSVISAFYRRLMKIARSATIREGLWAPLAVKHGGGESSSLLAFARVPLAMAVGTKGGTLRASTPPCLLTVVNMTNETAEGCVKVSEGGTAGGADEERGTVYSALGCLSQPPSGVVTLRDVVSNQVFRRGGIVLLEGGLHVKLPPWGYHILQITTAGALAGDEPLTCAAEKEGGGSDWRSLLVPSTFEAGVDHVWRL
jgi:hypothetical protein